MSATLAVRRPLARARLDGPVAGAAVAAVAAAAVAGAAASDPAAYRPVLAAALAGGLVMTSARWPRGAALATLSFLPFLALVRRLLIADSGWSERDPLLLVGPAVAVALVVQLFLLGGRPLVRGRLSALVAALLALALVQVANPAGGGVAVGAPGLLFLAVPLVWFFVGRELCDRATAALVVPAVVVVALIAAAYGLYQVRVGLPSWDAAWQSVDGYYALTIKGRTRGFASFASVAEYAYWLAAAAAFCLALGLHGRRVWLLPVLPLVAAVFATSARSIFVLCVVALVAVCALRALRPRAALVATAAVLLGLGLAVRVAGPALVTHTAVLANPLALHQVAGLVNPTATRSSTAGLHARLFVNGVKSGFSRPLGLGTGATSIAASTVTGRDPGTATEIDVSNAFVSLGLAGGLLYAATVALALLASVRLYASRRDPLALAVVGLLVATLGQWLTGGHYALAPLTWFLIGWVAHESGGERRGRH
jgi:hypothetical protein